MEYRHLLSRNERAFVLKAAMAAAVAQQPAEKRAALGLGKTIWDVLKGAAAVSVAAGVPIGVAWHMINQQSKITDNKTRDQLKRIEYYSDAAKGLESRLSNIQGIQPASRYRP